MSSDNQRRDERLSPISRRAFFRRVGIGSVQLGALGALVAMSRGCTLPSGLEGLINDGGFLPSSPETGDNCGYCDGAGRDYYHCDGNYCDYINYADAGEAPGIDGGGYNDSSPYGDAAPGPHYGNCGYCNGYGRDYYHCDGDYCDYINYSDVGYNYSESAYGDGSVYSDSGSHIPQ